MILASNNKGKIKEVKDILFDYEIYSLEDKYINIDVCEDQDTFYGNALKKATEIYQISHEPVLADDSGLCIDGLCDWPGVFTHRFLGENATDIERNEAILENMKSFNDNYRDARVICNMVYYDGEECIVGEGILKGKIAKVRKGNNGFGFDEIFELEDGRTLAELSCDEKNKVSARYLALVDLKEKLNQKKLIKNK